METLCKLIPELDPNFPEKDIIYFFSKIGSVPHKQLTMEQVFLRFSHLSETIFDSLDDQSLANCKEVSKSWYFYIDTLKSFYNQGSSKPISRS